VLALFFALSHTTPCTSCRLSLEEEAKEKKIAHSSRPRKPKAGTHVLRETASTTFPRKLSPCLDTLFISIKAREQSRRPNTKAAVQPWESRPAREATDAPPPSGVPWNPVLLPPRTPSAASSNQTRSNQSTRQR
ncbi:unnamed protein product, partial [Ectocarpus fasciculatus]